MLRIRKTQSPTPLVKSRIRITAVRKPFDPEAFAAVLVAAALARLTETKRQPAKKSRLRRPRGARR
jgi:hypothetical protein